MVDVLTSIDINVPLEKVADYANNPDNAPGWYENIKSVRWKTAGPLQVGSRVAFVANFLLKELSYTYEVAGYSDQKFVMKTAEGPFHMETTYSFEVISDHITRMTLRNKGKPAGFLGLFTPFISLMMKRANKKDLKKLKSILEHSRERKPG